MDEIKAGKGMLARARPEILAMKGYVSARSLVATGGSTVFLDANECPYEPFVGASGLARYPMQQPPELVRAICDWLDLSSRNVTVARGADEGIDCLMRAFCVPALDNIIICPPTFAMYAQSAVLQGVDVRKVPLTADFGLDAKGVLAAADENTKIVFICSPNNPTANIMDRDAVTGLCEALSGRALVVVDETYIDYADADSMASELERFENLVVLRTLSKSHAAAGLRCGVTVARADVTELLQKVLAPYPVPQPVVQAALAILTPANQARLASRREIIARRDAFAAQALATGPVKKILPTDANYLLMIVDDADALCARAADQGYILRNQSHQPGSRAPSACRSVQMTRWTGCWRSCVVTRSTHRLRNGWRAMSARQARRRLPSRSISTARRGADRHRCRVL